MQDMRLLLVEDEHEIQAFLRQALKRPGIASTALRPEKRQGIAGVNPYDIPSSISAFPIRVVLV
jgi:DNA-binding response OmpR family regulator